MKRDRNTSDRIAATHRPSHSRVAALLSALGLALLFNLAELPSATGAEEIDGGAAPSSTTRDVDPGPPRSEGLRGRHRRRRRRRILSAAIRPGFEFASRADDDEHGGASRLGTIDVSGLGDLSEVDAEASIVVQLFSDEPPMEFRRIPRRDDGGGPPADDDDESGGGGGGAVVQTLHAEDVSDDKGYTMSIVSVPVPAPSRNDTSSARRRTYVAGSVVTNDTIYDISTPSPQAGGMDEGTAIVEARRVEDLPDESTPILLEGVDYDANAMIVDNSNATAAFWTNESAALGEGDAEFGPSRELRRGNRGGGAGGSAMKNGGGSSANLDVMVVYTPNAMCAQRGLRHPCEDTPENRGPIEARIMLAVEETNTAFELSGVTTKVRLVRMHLAENIDDSDNELWTSGMTTLLKSLRSSANGFENVGDLRDSVGADFVSLITERKDFCGLAPLGPSLDAAFSIVSRVCSTGYYSFAHEVGHNFGCDHNPESAANKSPAYARGYRNEEAGIRSILAYECKTRRCTRVLRFSNSNGGDFNFNGMKIGDATHDNARQINQNVVRMSRYRPTRVHQLPLHTDPAAHTDEPTRTPHTTAPTTYPSNEPTLLPSQKPTRFPTQLPSQSPSNSPFAMATAGDPKSAASSPKQSAEGSSSTSYLGPYQLTKPPVGHWGSYGNQFDVRSRPDKNVRIRKFSIHTWKTSTVDVEVWTRSGSHLLNDSHDNRDGGWALIQDVSVVGRGRYSLTPLPEFSSPVVIPAGSVQAFTVVLKRGGLACAQGTSKTAISVANDVLVVYEGSYINRYYGRSVASGWLPRNPRIWEGIVFYDVERSSDGNAGGNGAIANSANEEIHREGGTDNDDDSPAAAAASRRKPKRGGILSWVGGDRASVHLVAGNETNAAEEEEHADEDEVTADALPEEEAAEEEKEDLTPPRPAVASNVTSAPSPTATSDDDNFSGGDGGDCFDDPLFRSTYSGTEVNCRWVEENPARGCQLEAEAENNSGAGAPAMAIDSCSCACGAYRPVHTSNSTQM